MQINYNFNPKEFSKMEIISFLDRNKLINAISKYVDPIRLHTIINSGAIDFIYKSKYEFLEMSKLLFMLKDCDDNEEYLKAFLNYRDSFIKFFKIEQQPLGCEREYSKFDTESLCIDTFSALRDITNIPFEIYTEYIYDKNAVKLFIDTFGTNIISDPVAEIVELDLEEEISIDDSFYHEYMIDKVANYSCEYSTLAVEDRDSTGKYNWIENDERISKIIDLTPSIHEIGISYFYSKEIDAFIENECNRNEESNLLIQFINEFDNIVGNAARDTLTHSNVKIIDRSSRMFPRNIRNKYAIICGFTSPGLFCTSISMDIGNSVFSLIDGIFFNSILNSINNINEIIKK